MAVPKKEVLYIWILLSLSVLCAAILGEMGLRLMGYKGAPESLIANIRPIDDPILNWRYLPGSEVQTGKIKRKYNKSGFRDVDHNVEKAPGVKRILVVGDSVTEAGDVEWEAVFSSRLQADLGRSYEVITLAMGGLNTPQEIHLFEKEGLAYKPDLMILNFVLNDADFYTEYNATQRYQAEKDSVVGVLGISINPAFKRTLKSSALVYFLKQRFEHAIGMFLGKEEIGYFENLWGKAENRQRVTNGFDRLWVMSKDSSFPVLVVIWPILTEFSRYKFEHIHQWVREEAEKRGFQTLDLLPHFAKTSYRNLQVTAEDNIHPNGLGHKIGADAFLEWIR
ncbi:MAG TPA: SGNH/GDSL hydrolase family protein [Nitrospira sp.]|jgi:lysophospholipase L1-like esterase|nr:SGNH/GDSL hydrolase family protein [Nitrospira sp.]HRB15657.1 SGNH/GDSL hydrolase family protein [Nitrospira sp.]